jgi:hypothetical protein
MSYEKALETHSRDERFKATIYAMNTLLIHKGIYTQEEFQRLVVEWAQKKQVPAGSARPLKPAAEASA